MFLMHVLDLVQTFTDIYSLTYIIILPPPSEADRRDYGYMFRDNHLATATKTLKSKSRLK